MAPGNIEYSDGRFFKRIEGDDTHAGTLGGTKIVIEDSNEGHGLIIFIGESEIPSQLKPGETIDLDSGKCVIPLERKKLFSS